MRDKITINNWFPDALCIGSLAIVRHAGKKHFVHKLTAPWQIHVCLELGTDQKYRRTITHFIQVRIKSNASDILHSHTGDLPNYNTAVKRPMTKLLTNYQCKSMALP